MQEMIYTSVIKILIFIWAQVLETVVVVFSRLRILLRKYLDNMMYIVKGLNTLITKIFMKPKPYTNKNDRTIISVFM